MIVALIGRAVAKEAVDTEVYQAFMQGYVRRINEATFRVPIGGVRVGSAKYSRLAQINLNSRIITFSRFAIENVPERGRRYLVLHELAHVKESGHNKRFWSLVGQFEPDYKRIAAELQLAFRENVQLLKPGSRTKLLTRLRSPLDFKHVSPDFNSNQELISGSHLHGGESKYQAVDVGDHEPGGFPGGSELGIVHGGSEDWDLSEDFLDLYD